MKKENLCVISITGRLISPHHITPYEAVYLAGKDHPDSGKERMRGWIL